MAKYTIGLDFGTSQTKVCVHNIDNDIREFILFDNNTFFLPSLITKNSKNQFRYGDENEEGIKYRYFKMAAAEDPELIQVTNENIEGKIEKGKLSDFEKYSTNFDIIPEILVILYLTHIILYIKNKYDIKNEPQVGNFLRTFLTTKKNTANEYSINLGIPTEWNNPNHIKRKIKFQSLLLTASILADKMETKDKFLRATESELINSINSINKSNLDEYIDTKNSILKDGINELLRKKCLSVFPESAAGINYLLKTKRLADGAYATLDIGAGTSDIAIFQVFNNNLNYYYCSESVEIAANDFYREYAREILSKTEISFDEIKHFEDQLKNINNIIPTYYKRAKQIVKGNSNTKGIEYAIRKTFYRKYYIKCYNINKNKALSVKKELDEKPIIVFGGGANLDGFCTGTYCYFQGSNPFGIQDNNFEARPITDFVNQVTISNASVEIAKNINLLILALGLTYIEKNSEFVPFTVPANETSETNEIVQENFDSERYFYYDLQDAAFK